MLEHYEIQILGLIDAPGAQCAARADRRRSRPRLGGDDRLLVLRLPPWLVRGVGVHFPPACYT